MYSPLANPLDLIVQRYREAIVTKRLSPGSTLWADEEAHALGVPIHIVKAAFRTLGSVGLIDLQTGGKAVVKSNTIQSLQALEFGLTRRRA